MARKTVLYVEDEEDDAIFMRLAFSRNELDLGLHVVGTGQQAIDYLAGKPPFADRAKFPEPALVLLDLNLPVISGFEVLKWLREQSQFQKLPVIVFSSSGRPEDRSTAETLGADHYMQKPSSGLEFTDTASYLQKRFLARPAGST
jgi:CheY-like chemotaxis protein